MIKAMSDDAGPATVVVVAPSGGCFLWAVTPYQIAIDLIQARIDKRVGASRYPR